MSASARELLEEYRRDYGVEEAELSESETIEYLKYIELAQLKEQNNHLKSIKAVVALMAAIAMLFIAVGFLACLVTFGRTSAAAGFFSFIFMIIFLLLAVGMFRYRK